MAIEFQRPRKGKRVAVVSLTTGDKKDIVIGSGYYPLESKAVIAFGEMNLTGQNELLNGTIRDVMESGNAILIWFSSVEAIERFEEHLAKIKRNFNGTKS